MAKQRGVVQLSGRVDNLCYYQQKRVRGGLVRRINLAMGERVKAGDEYVNLRTANSFFGACSMLAAAMLSLINKRALYMTRTDRQSFLTTRIMQICYNAGVDKTADNIPFGNLDARLLVSAFNSTMKLSAAQFFINLPLVRYEVPIGATMVFEISSFELDRYLSFFGGEEVYVNFYYKCYVEGIFRDAITGKFTSPVAETTINRSAYFWRPGDPDLELHVSAGDDDESFNCCIFVFDIVRYRIGGRPIYLRSASTAHMVGVSFG